VFEIDDEESGEKVQAIESLRFLRDASNKFQTRNIQLRGDIARLEMKGVSICLVWCMKDQHNVPLQLV